MISNLREFAKTGVAKVLMVIIVIPFVFWGMGGVFSTGSTNSIAKINNYNLSTQDFVDHLNKAKLDSETIKENIENNVLEELLGNLISTTLIKMEIEDLNISISEKILAKKIKKNKVFLDSNNKFSRTKYEKFLLSNNIPAPDFEAMLKDEELQKNLFLYISGGIKSPFFITNETFKEQTKKLNIKYINLIDVYKKKEKFSDNEIELYINENQDQLKVEQIDFSYLKLTPQNLIESDEYNELFFERIDEIEDKISNGIDFKNIISELKIQPTIKTNYLSNIENDKTEEKIYKKRNESKIQLIDENEFFVLYEISKIDKILPNLSDESFKNKIKEILYEKSKYEYNFKLISDINNKKFNENDFVNLVNDNSVVVEQIQLNSIEDDNKFDSNSVKLMYALPINSFTLISDDEQNIYLAKIIKSNHANILKNTNEYKIYNSEANKKIKDKMYSSYDLLLNNKYKVKINQKTLERVKNYYK